MCLNDFNEVVQTQLKHCASLLFVKGDEYVHTADRLGSFKTAAALQHETPKQALLGMLAKHLVSVSDMCMSDTIEKLESWDEKITDSINYLLLLKALVTEELKNG